MPPFANPIPPLPIQLPNYQIPQLPNSVMRCVVLLSGGLDSYTAAAIARAEGFELFALTVRYGQRHIQEIEAARKVAGALGVTRHLELQLDLRCIGGSALTGSETVPRDRDLSA